MYNRCCDMAFENGTMPECPCMPECNSCPPVVECPEERCVHREIVHEVPQE